MTRCVERIGRGRRLSLSTSRVPRPRDNLSTGDAHTINNTVYRDLFQISLIFVL